MAYSFQLAGYTAAIIAFTIVNTRKTRELWDIAQAHVREVIVGILCGGFMMMVLPNTSDGSALITELKNMHMHARLLEHATLLWKPETTDAIRTAHESVIGQILTLNLLRIQAFWSHYRFRRQNNLLNYLLHQQLRMTSVISSLWRMILNIDTLPPAFWPTLEQIIATLADSHADKYQLARLLSPMHKTVRAIIATVHCGSACAIFAGSIRITAAGCTTWLPLLRSHILAHLKQLHWHDAQITQKRCGGGIRTFFVIILTGAWCLNTQWKSGSSTLSLAAISCVLYSTSPTLYRSLTLLIRTLVLLTIFSFVVKFGLMVKITDLWQFLLFLVPLLITMQLLKLQQPKLAGLWGQLIVFMGSFISVTNPPLYEFFAFMNDDLAKLIGVGMSWLAFSILRPGSDTRKGQRHIRTIRRGFVDQLSRRPCHSESQFESLVYSHQPVK